MCGHDHAAGYSLRSHWKLWTIVEAARCLAFGTLLDLIGGQVQPRLDLRMIEQVVVFATAHKRKPCHIGDHGPIAILPIQPQQRARSFELIRRQIPANGGERLAQFFPIPPVPSIPETAEPLITMRLRHCCPCPDNLPAFATSVARGADVTQPAKGWGKLISLGQGALPGCLPCPIKVKDHPAVPCSIPQPSGLLVRRQRAGEQIIEKERAQGFDWSLGERCQKAREG